jgi:hypothetical protein
MNITSANAVIMLTIPGLFPIPQQLEGFAADDIFTTDPINPIVPIMGMDGKLSGGFVPRPKIQNFTLQADSASNFLFESWQATQESTLDVLPAGAVVVISGIGREYTCLVGLLTNYSVAPDARQTLQPRRYQITWQNVFGAPI